MNKQSLVKRDNGEQLNRLGCKVATLNRRMCSNERNNEQQYEIMIQRFEWQDNMLRQLLDQPMQSVLGYSVGLSSFRVVAPASVCVCVLEGTKCTCNELVFR